MGEKEARLDAGPLRVTASPGPKPSLRGGGPPGLRPVPHRAGALGPGDARLAYFRAPPVIPRTNVSINKL
jgi:hypothetical protein